MSDDDIDLPFVRGHQGLVDGVAADEDLRLMVALGIELLYGLNILVQIVAEREPDSDRLLSKDGLNARVFGRFGHVANPAEETNADGHRRVSRDVQSLAHRLKALLDFVRRIEAYTNLRILQDRKQFTNAPAPMKPKPPAPETAAARSGVEANAIGAATIGLRMSVQ